MVQQISPFVQHPYNCMMQLCRVSRRALTLLLEKRRALGERFLLERRDPNSWPNDEAFVAATLVEQGLRTALFSEHAPNFRHAGTFTFVKPTSARWLEHLPLNGHDLSSSRARRQSSSRGQRHILI